MMRVAFFAPVLITGGTQRHLQQVLRLLDRQRFATRVFTLRPGGEVAAELAAGGVPVTSLNIPGRLTTPAAAVAMLRAARILRAEGTDVVHGYQWRPALVGTIVGQLARVPLIVAGKRSLTAGDGSARFAWRVMAKRVDTIVANAEALRLEAEADGVDARWEIIPNGVDVDWFRVGPPSADAKRRLGLDPDRPVVGTIGRLEPRKGQELLLLAGRVMAARRRTARAQLLLVGDGPLRAGLAAEAARLGLGDDVRFTGNLPDVRGALAAMDVFVLPSKEEGMSNALLEAMAAGRPVVATRVGGNGEVIDGARTGALVEPGDADGLAGEVLSLLDDPVRATRMGREAQRWVESRFGARAAVARLERFYEERLAARRGRRAA
jgi:glycosyltransferase involved in cell wall biosynthesis